MAEYIERETAKRELTEWATNLKNPQTLVTDDALCVLDLIPATDVVPMDDLKKWLWKVALNNSDNYLGDACAELVSRLDGLRRYVQDGGAKMDEEGRRCLN